MNPDDNFTPAVDTYPANWDGTLPYSTQEEACAYYNRVSGNVDLNIELKYNLENQTWYINNLVDVAINGYYLVLHDGILYTILVEGQRPAVNLGETSLLCV